MGLFNRGRKAHKRKLIKRSVSLIEEGKGLSEVRKQKIKLRKNFLPTLLAITLLWSSVFLTIYHVDPAQFGALPLFFILVFLSLLFTFSALFANTAKGFIIAFSLALFLALRYFGVGNILNSILIIALAISSYFYFFRD